MRIKLNAIALSIVAMIIVQLPAMAKVKVQNSVVVDAKMESVWDALLKYQKEEKQFNKKMVSNQRDKVTIKEEFVRVPVVGAAHIDYEEINHKDLGRIDYKLTKSKFLTTFEGAWTVKKNDSGKGVVVTLTTHIDSWVPAPFKSRILRNATKKGMEKRLAFVKTQAEKLSQTN